MKSGPVRRAAVYHECVEFVKQFSVSMKRRWFVIILARTCDSSPLMIVPHFCDTTLPRVPGEL
jgi:hypothetical protein